MQYKRLGKTGLKISRICLGMMTYGDPSWRNWVLPEEKSYPFFQKALTLGINFFDTADMYSLGVSETILGNAVKQFSKRDQVVIASKVYHPMGDGPNEKGLSRKHIFDSIEASLRRLQTDYIDLYQIHRWDYETPIEETLQALDDLVRSGKVRYIGASSMHAWQFAKALYLARHLGVSRFVSMQNHYNLLYREEEREMMPLCREEGIGVIPWSPLARGILAGNRDDPEQTSRAKSDEIARKLYEKTVESSIVDRVKELAKKHEKSPAQIALAWLLSKPEISAPIIGASQMTHLEEAVDAIEITLEPKEKTYLEEPYKPRPVLGHS